MLEDKDLLSVQEVRTKVEKAWAAWQKYRTYSQEQIDAIVERMAAAARANARRLAELAVEETGFRDECAGSRRSACCANCPRRRSSKSAFRWVWSRRFCRRRIPLRRRCTSR